MDACKPARQPAEPECLDSGFGTDLARFGPDQTVVPSKAEAQAYCRRLARRHYENFSVASLLVPRPLRPHFFAVYAYCRWADDLADELSSMAQSLSLLQWWESELRDCYKGRARHPVFVALRETIGPFAIPIEPFLALLEAFRRDQHQHRYATRAELLDYCRSSANPVGHLVLYLGRCFSPERAGLADRICTGLQLANFCQDVCRDFERGRIYLPQESWQAAGYDESQFARHEFNAAFRELLATEVDFADRELCAGLELVRDMPRALRAAVWLFAQGGRTILANIRRAGYNVWRRRPTVSRCDQARLVVGYLWRRARAQV